MTACYYMKTSPRMKFTLDLTLQGKATYIFSSRCSGLCTPALQQPLAVTQWRISKVCFHMAHSKSRASGVKRVLHSTAGGFFFSYLFFFFFCRQSGTHGAWIDLQTEMEARLANPRLSTATEQRVCPRDQMRKQELSLTEAFSLPQHRPPEGRLASILL